MVQIQMILAGALLDSHAPHPFCLARKSKVVKEEGGLVSTSKARLIDVFSFVS